MTRGRPFAKWIILLFLVVICLTGCQAGTVIDNAQSVIELARAIHGDYLAPYEFTSATLYLAQAKKEYECSDFKAAEVFAQKALAQGQAAFKISLEKNSKPMVPEKKETKE